MPGWGPLCGKEWHPGREPARGAWVPAAVLALLIAAGVVVLALT